MISEGLLKEVDSARDFFNRSSSVLTEDDSPFTPLPGLYTVATHVAHVAITVDWFIGGTFGGKGWDMDFEKHIADARAVTSLAAARSHFEKAIENAKSVISMKSDAELMEMIPADDPILPDVHHRGALTVYARHLKKEPRMPYGE